MGGSHIWSYNRWLEKSRVIERAGKAEKCDRVLCHVKRIKRRRAKSTFSCRKKGADEKLSRVLGEGEKRVWES